MKLKHLYLNICLGTKEQQLESIPLIILSLRSKLPFYTNSCVEKQGKILYNYGAIIMIILK